MVKSAAGKRAKKPAEKVTALNLAPLDPLPEAIAAYFAKCDEKLGLVPNVLKAYAFDEAKFAAFTAFYNELMLAPSGLQAGAGDDRRRRVLDQSLLLLPGGARRGGARAVGRPGPRRGAGDESPRRRSVGAPPGNAGLRRQADGGAGRHGGGGQAGASRRRLLGPRHLGHRRGGRLLQHV
jgi:hypothetical protein